MLVSDKPHIKKKEQGTKTNDHSQTKVKKTRKQKHANQQKSSKQKNSTYDKTHRIYYRKSNKKSNTKSNIIKANLIGQYSFYVVYVS